MTVKLYNTFKSSMLSQQTLMSFGMSTNVYYMEHQGQSYTVKTISISKEGEGSPAHRQ
jgi:hypothetical protein